MEQARKKKILAVVLIVLILAPAVIWYVRGWDASAFREKLEPLRQAATADWVKQELGQAPAGEAGFAVFLSVSSGEERARVRCGTGGILEDAWKDAAEQMERVLRRSRIQPRWVKADVVFLSREISGEELREAMSSVPPNGFRYGLAFDGAFSCALLEAELNAGGIYDYRAGGVDLEALDRYLKADGRKALGTIPRRCTVFQTIGWLCGEDGRVEELSAGGASYGRRRNAAADPEEVRAQIRSAAGYLASQVGEDGAFAYGVYPGEDREIQERNILCHAGAVWAMALCRGGREEEDGALDRAVQYMLDRIVYRDPETAFLPEEDGEIKLGGGALAVIALTEYMEARQSGAYEDVCRALGGGILAMADPETGAFCHVLHPDFSLKEEQRTVYYDGEAVFALCRLYGLTGEDVWLQAAQRAADRWVAADYAQYKDHWVSLAMNELTKHITDEPAYYALALENARRALADLGDETDPTRLELLAAAFELYGRVTDRGASVEGLDREALPEAVLRQAERQLDGYLYPEFAMYLARPQEVLGAFMVRQDGFRVRIDDVQHAIVGYDIYLSNYEKLTEYVPPSAS